eukprot:m.115340 g.115340  ORF g.115340 m.115340 type:complete len:441 (+) comp37543_c0_seq1:97-1419(+)
MISRATAPTGFRTDLKLSVILAIILAMKTTTALDNGLALTPAMGFNAWYALHHHLLSPSYEWEQGYVLSEDVLQVAQWMKQNGYQELGYKYINFDDCIVMNRTAEGILVPDPQAFPHGVLNTSNSVHAMGFKFGWYSDRGEYTCSCWEGGPKRPGSQGHEKTDAETYATWGVDYLKEDSCYAGSQDPIKAYSTMRDALNATKRPIYFNMCWGAGGTVAKIGKSLANAWRIAVDDGGGWVPIMKNVEVDSQLYKYSGPGGWNDPGLLIAGLLSNQPQGGRRYKAPEYRSDAKTVISDIQGRSQFNLWSVLAAKLLISADPRTFSSYTNETYTNAEVIAVNQDPLGQQGKRFTPAGTPGSPGEVWGRRLHDGWALLYFNNNGTKAVDIDCNSTCWAQTDFAANEKVNMRDLWKHENVGTASGSYVVHGVEPDASIMLKLTKA